MRYLPTAVAVLAIGWINGCASNGGASMSSAPPGDLVDRYWRLVSIEGTPIEPPLEGREAHLVLHAQGHVMGAVGGINQMGGTWGVSGTAIKLLPGPMTRMAGPEPLMRQEDKFVNLLSKVDRYEIDGNRLTLFQGFAPLLEFVGGRP